MNPEHISNSRTANQMALFSMKSMQHICLGRLTTAKGSTLFETLPTLVSLCERTNQNWPSENSSSTMDHSGLHTHFFRDCSLLASLDITRTSFDQKNRWQHPPTREKPQVTQTPVLMSAQQSLETHYGKTLFKSLPTLSSPCKNYLLRLRSLNI